METVRVERRSFTVPGYNPALALRTLTFSGWPLRAVRRLRIRMIRLPRILNAEFADAEECLVAIVAGAAGRDVLAPHQHLGENLTMIDYTVAVPCSSEDRTGYTTDFGTWDVILKEPFECDHLTFDFMDRRGRRMDFGQGSGRIFVEVEASA